MPQGSARANPPTRLGAPESPILGVDTRVLPAGLLRPGTLTRLELRITNLGLGLLEGSLMASQNWIAVPPRFKGDHTAIPVDLDTHGLAKGQIHLGRLFVRSYGGAERVTVVLGLKSGFLQAPLDPQAYELALARQYVDARMWEDAIRVLSGMTSLTLEKDELLREARAAIKDVARTGREHWDKVDSLD